MRKRFLICLATTIITMTALCGCSFSLNGILDPTPTDDPYLIIDVVTPTPDPAETAAPTPSTADSPSGTPLPSLTSEPSATGSPAPTRASEQIATTAPGPTQAAAGGVYLPPEIIVPKLDDKIKKLAQQCSADYDEKRVIRLIIDTLITDDMNEFDKVKTIHDYLILTTTYDRANLNAGTASKSVYKTYGCIIGHKCVCQGYAYAFMDIMTELGIDCVELSGGNHAWNAVKLYGNWYYIDVTWDDPFDGSKSKPQSNYYKEFDYPHYEYFLVPERIITEKHTLDKCYNSSYKLTDLPVCTDETYYNYFKNVSYPK